MPEPPEHDDPQPGSPETPGEESRPVKRDTGPLNVLRGGPPARSGSGAKSRSAVLREVLAQGGAGDATELASTADRRTGRVRRLARIPKPPPWRVIFQTQTATPTLIGVDVREPVVIGRHDPDRPDNPGLDLSPHHAVEYGISRQHAVLLPAPEGLYLIDLASTNGTWINGAYLSPRDRHLLQIGERIEFGLLQLVVKALAELRR